MEDKGPTGIRHSIQADPFLRRLVETVLHVLKTDATALIRSPLWLSDAAGNLYGTAAEGGRTCDLNGCGWCSSCLRPPAANGGKWCCISSKAEGRTVPLAGVTLDATGNLYGTTFYGGANGCPSTGTAGCGVVFELSPDSSGWKEIVLHVFTGAGDGGAPGSGVTLIQQGMFMAQLKPGA